MKVNQIISNIDQNSGGTATYIQGLSKFLIKKNIDLTISTLKTKSPLYFESSIKLNYCNNLIFKRFNDYDVFHINGLWGLFIHKMVLLSKKSNTPYIVSPHGMLENWSLSQSKFKKKVALFLYQKKDLIESDCIHVTAILEMNSVRKLGIKNPIAVIPNGIDVSIFPKKISQKVNEKKTFLFLSRIHPKKGIELLIDAWANLKHSKKKNWQIKIIGNGKPEYIDELKNRILKRGLQNCVYLLPPIFEIKKKNDVFYTSDVFVLPSYSENFGIVIAEALASFTPVITTKATPWKDLADHNCGWWIDVGVVALQNTLGKVLDMNNDELKKMGNNGRNLIEEKYSVEAIANKTYKMYDWVINKGEKPCFIYV